MSAFAAMMEGIIDYAGLFPPAELPMQPVVDNYAVYHQGPHRAMLGRLICSAARFEELATCVRPMFWGWHEGELWPIAALGRGGDNVVTFLARLTEDLAAMQTLDELCGPRLRVVAWECRLPDELLEEIDATAITQLVDKTARHIADGAPNALTPYLELSFSGDWRTNVPEVIAGIAAHNRAHAEVKGRCAPFGVKLRTGGIEASMFPSVDQVTHTIQACKAERVAFKATAGLHHPVRRFDESVQAKMHGFFNVFGAAVLTHAQDLDTSTVACIVEDEDPKHFRRDDNAFSWQHLAATADEVTAARKDLAHSFGSCSFDEPIDDLRALGMI
jgi:hypothetical protein